MNEAKYVRWLLAVLATGFLYQGCSDDEEPLIDTTADTSAVDTTDGSDGTDDVVEADVTDTTMVDVEDSEDTGEADVESPDAGEPDAGPTPAEPSPVQVGVGRLRIPFPLGIGMPGSFQFSAGGGGPESRYTGAYPATTKIYTHPTMHAVALRNDDETIVMLRLDTIGLTQEIRRAAIARIIERGGPDLTHGLIMAATHTHTGPGRLVDNELWAAITDSFLPQFFERMVDSMADVVLASLDDLEPGKFGFTFLNTDDLHTDRRCQNEDLMDGTLPVIRLDRADGTPKAVVAMYAVHGTALSAKLNTLSRDFHGAMELKLEERFEQPVTVLFFNSWSGDMKDKLGSVDDHQEIPTSYNGMEAAGNTFADLVMENFDAIETKTDVVLGARMERVPLNLEALGYGDGEFDWEYGAVYCGFGTEAECFGGTPPDPLLLTINCVPFPENDPAPMSTVVGVVALDEMIVATMAGEPLTEIGLRIVNTIAEQADREHVALLGYAQDYIGYNLSEEDWYYGDYETSGAMWGPKQGDYLAARTIELAVSELNGTSLPWEPLGPGDAPSYTPEPMVTETPSTAPAVLLQPATTATVGGMVTVTFAGGDPWWLAPVVSLERQQADGSFAAETYPSGRTIDSHGYEFELELAVTPSYEETLDPVGREFAWTAHFATKRPAPSTAPDRAGGTFRFRIQGNTSATETYDLTSEPFTVE